MRMLWVGNDVEKICLNITIKINEQILNNFKQTSDIALFLLLTLNKYMAAGQKKLSRL